jgi:hypothetical protein
MKIDFTSSTHKFEGLTLYTNSKKNWVPALFEGMKRPEI